MKRICAIGFGLMLTTGVAAAQGPATRVTAAAAESSPGGAAAVGDYSSPKAAARTFFSAVQAQSMAGKPGPEIHDTLLIAPAHKEDIEALLGTMTAQGRLLKAVVKRFGADGAKVFGMSAASTLLEARLKNIDDAKVETNGDTATLEMAGDAATQQPAGTMTLKKVNGQWKVDAGAMFQVDTTPAATLAENVKLAGKVTQVTDEMTQAVDGGRFNSANEAFQEYWMRSNAARVSLMSPATGTAPATGPAAPRQSEAPATQSK